MAPLQVLPEFPWHQGSGFAPVGQVQLGQDWSGLCPKRKHQVMPIYEVMILISTLVTQFIRKKCVRSSARRNVKRIPPSTGRQPWQMFITLIGCSVLGNANSCMAFLSWHTTYIFVAPCNRWHGRSFCHKNFVPAQGCTNGASHKVVPCPATASMRQFDFQANSRWINQIIPSLLPSDSPSEFCSKSVGVLDRWHLIQLGSACRTTTVGQVGLKHASPPAKKIVSGLRALPFCIWTCSIWTRVLVESTMKQPSWSDSHCNHHSRIQIRQHVDLQIYIYIHTYIHIYIWA